MKKAKFDLKIQNWYNQNCHPNAHGVQSQLMLFPIQLRSIQTTHRALKNLHFLPEYYNKQFRDVGHTAIMKTLS